MIFLRAISLFVAGLLTLTVVALPMPHSVSSGQHVTLARRDDMATTETTLVYRRCLGVGERIADRVLTSATLAHMDAADAAPNTRLAWKHADAVDAVENFSGSDIGAVFYGLKEKAKAARALKKYKKQKKAVCYHNHWVKK